MLGVGTWDSYLTERGGGTKLLSIPYTSFNFSRVLNNTHPSSMEIGLAAPNNEAGEFLQLAEPFRHEVCHLRNGVEEYVGPLWDIDPNDRTEGSTLSIKCLYSWMMRRFIEEDMVLSADLAYIFEAVFNKAMEPDTSPNVTVSTKDTGVTGVRNYRGKDLQKAADILGALATTAVDFTTVGRQVIAGGLEILLPADPLLVHDDGVSKATLSKAGSDFSTDFGLIGAVPRGQNDPVVGRAERGSDVYGLVQDSAVDLQMEDEVSAETGALSRLMRMQPVPQRLNVVFSPQADMELNELIPGARADIRLSNVSGCLEVNEMMRLQSVNVSVNVSEAGVTEEITGVFTPLGLSES